MFVLISSISWIKFQTCFNTPERGGFLKSVIMFIQRDLPLKYLLFNCSKQITAKLRLRSMQRILKKELKTIHHRSAIGPNACVLVSKYFVRRTCAMFGWANRKMNPCVWVRRDKYHSLIQNNKYYTLINFISEGGKRSLHILDPEHSDSSFLTRNKILFLWETDPKEHCKLYLHD